VFARDGEEGERIARRLQVGAVCVDDAAINTSRWPRRWGRRQGIRPSAFGTALGEFANSPRRRRSSFSAVDAHDGAADVSVLSETDPTAQSHRAIAYTAAARNLQRAFV